MIYLYQFFSMLKWSREFEIHWAYWAHYDVMIESPLGFRNSEPWLHGSVLHPSALTCFSLSSYQIHLSYTMKQAFLRDNLGYQVHLSHTIKRASYE